MPTEPGSRTQGAQTADRALGLLSVLVDAAEPLGLSELAARTGLSKQTTLRMLRPLAVRQYVVKDPGGHGYVMGPGLLALAGQVLTKLPLRELSRPAMHAIQQATGETVTLHTRHAATHVCVDVLESAQQIRRVVRLGEEVSMLEGTGSMAMLPWLPEVELDLLFGLAEEQRHDLAALRSKLVRSARSGYYAAIGERVPGGAALSVPVLDALGLRGCITVSGPATRFDQKTMDAVAPFVRGSCAELSQSMGYTGPSHLPASAVPRRR